MSVRAYKLIEIKTEEQPTFNLNETDITMLASSDEGGIMSFNKDTLTEELAGVRAGLKGLAGDSDEGAYKSNLLDVELTLETMIKECGDEDYVEYYCY